MRAGGDSERRFRAWAAAYPWLPAFLHQHSESTCNRCGMLFNSNPVTYQRYWTPPAHYLGGPCEACRELACMYDLTPYGARVRPLLPPGFRSSSREHFTLEDA